jgi:ribosomal protein S4E
MRSNIISLFIIIISISCNNKTDDFSVMEHDKLINLGNVKRNDTIQKSIKIKNNSDITLKIKQIKSSCGCTVVAINDSTISTGKSTELKIRYISDSKKGHFSKSIVIDANTKPSFNVIYLKGIIE